MVGCLTSVHVMAHLSGDVKEESSQIYVQFMVNCLYEFGMQASSIENLKQAEN